MLAPGHLPPDTDVKIKVRFGHLHINLLCYIPLSLFLTNSVAADFISEKLYSSQSELNYILITKNPQIPVAQNNKGFFFSLIISHGHA